MLLLGEQIPHWRTESGEIIHPIVGHVKAQTRRICPVGSDFERFGISIDSVNWLAGLFHLPGPAALAALTIAVLVTLGVGIENVK